MDLGPAYQNPAVSGSTNLQGPAGRGARLCGERRQTIPVILWLAPCISPGQLVFALTIPIAPHHNAPRPGWRGG